MVRILHTRNNSGRSQGTGSEVHPGNGQAHGDVQGQASNPVDRSLRRY